MALITIDNIIEDFVPYWPQTSENLIPFLENEIGKPIGKNKVADYAFLVKQYQAYHAYWYSKFGDREPKYIPKNHQLVSPAEFLQNEMYLKKWLLQKRPRDFYLFGKMTQEQLEISLKDFLQNNTRKNVKIEEPKF